VKQPHWCSSTIISERSLRRYEKGKRIFANLQRAFLYLIGFHIPIVGAALVVPLLDKPLLLTPGNLILLELILRLQEVLLPFVTRLSITAVVTLLYLWQVREGDSPDSARTL
jgi:hypothetical protein